jgi:hypothetical protein
VARRHEVAAQWVCTVVDIRGRDSRLSDQYLLQGWASRQEAILIRVASQVALLQLALLYEEALQSMTDSKLLALFNVAGSGTSSTTGHTVLGEVLSLVLIASVFWSRSLLFFFSSCSSFLALVLGLLEWVQRSKLVCERWLGAIRWVRSARHVGDDDDQVKLLVLVIRS